MKYRKQALATALVLCIFQLSLVQSLTAAITTDPAEARRVVLALGVGKHVVVNAAGEERRMGSFNPSERGHSQ